VTDPHCVSDIKITVSIWTYMIRYTIYCSWVSTRWQWFLHLYMKGKNSDILREKQWSSHNTKWKERHKTVKKKRW